MTCSVLMIYSEERVIVNEDSNTSFTIDVKAVLSFATGADHPPPMGFPNCPEIMFETEADRTLPRASTCGPVLYLPLTLNDPDYFRARMDYALGGAHGFGNP